LKSLPSSQGPATTFHVKWHSVPLEFASCVQDVNVLSTNFHANQHNTGDFLIKLPTFKKKKKYTAVYYKQNHSHLATSMLQEKALRQLYAKVTSKVMAS